MGATTMQYYPIQNGMAADEKSDYFRCYLSLTPTVS